MRTSRDQNFLFLSEPPETLLCPLHYGVYEDPVVLPCGHTFCLECVEMLSKHKTECPLDRLPFTKAQLIPNRCVADQVDALIIVCPNGAKTVRMHSHDIFIANPHGCPHLCTIANLDNHLKTCTFGASSSSAGPSTSSLPITTEPCLNIETEESCPNAPMGCLYKSSARGIEHHSTNECPFSAMRNRLLGESIQIQLLKMKTELQESEIKLLRSKLQRDTNIPNRGSGEFGPIEDSSNPFVFIGEFARSVSSKVFAFAEIIEGATASIRDMFKETEEEKQQRVIKRMQERADLEAKLARLKHENEQIRNRKASVGMLAEPTNSLESL